MNTAYCYRNDGDLWQSCRYDPFRDISDPLTVNQYNYALGNYLNYKDPSGNALYDAGYIKSPKGTSFKLTDYAKELIGK